MRIVHKKPCPLIGILYQAEIKLIKNKLYIRAQMNSRAANGLEQKSSLNRSIYELYREVKQKS